MNNSNFINGLLSVLGIMILLAIIMAWPVQLLWNYNLVPAVDGINPIGFWQALGINILFSILFKSSSSSNK